MEQLIARDKEIEQLKQCLDSPRSEFVIVCGRRRIGKTFLVDSLFGGKYDFTFVGSHKAKTKVQLRKFAKTLSEFSGGPVPKITDWYEAFDALEAYLGALPADRKKVVFIDEMPWIDTARSTFVSALEDFWNGWANRRDDILFIATGSATSWMADKLISNQGGLHNRITQRIYLRPFTLRETEQYVRSRDGSWTRYDILQCYMFAGGVPYYLSLMDFKLSVAQNIDRLCFAEDGQLRHEYHELYPALFTHVESYLKVVETLYHHKDGLVRKEITNLTGLNGKFLTTILHNLEMCSFIMTREMFGKTGTLVYRLSDFYTLFYLKFIADRNKLDDSWWSHHLDDAGILAWEGLAFELICMQHYVQIKKALGIAGVATEISTWKCGPDEARDLPGAQIDMIIARADRLIHLCEIKFSGKPYNITADYEKRLRDRMWLFDLRTKNRRPLVHTFVTTFGLGEGRHHSIVHSEVTMDDLFAS